MEEEEGENEEIVGDDQESDQKPVFDLINEMNSLDTNGSNNIDPGHQ
ncbi:LOB domain-containing protein, partial [Trifolium medium]|nr:LOB domain-containing protein [Trifolium medium]